MRFQRNVRRCLMSAAVLGALGCSNGGTDPNDGGGDGGGGGGDGGGGGGGAVGAITVGNIFFRSDHNGTTNPAIDTVPANTTVTWTWTNTGSTDHSVRSTGAQSFTSSGIQAGNGSTYSFAFGSTGTYQYDCEVHGSAMSGTIVVE